MNIHELNRELDELNLLKHPFYHAWNMGELSETTLGIYAKEYYHHVAAFPRYLSRIHSNCPDIKTRQILLANLNEEEDGENNHPQLWKDFARRFAVSDKDLESTPELSETNELVNQYFEIVDKDFARGIGALYAYERQTPEVAKSKIEGLQKHYDVHDETTLKFFNVHITADEWHSEECAAIIENLPAQDIQRAKEGAIEGAKLLWKFLDGMLKVHLESNQSAQKTH